MVKQKSILGIHEARTHFAKLLTRVEQGEEITITRRGVPVARLIPIQQRTTPEQRREAIEAMRRIAERNTLGGLRIKDLIAEGRR